MNEFEPQTHTTLLQCYAPDGTMSCVYISGYTSIEGVIQVLKDTFPLCKGLKCRKENKPIGQDATANAYAEDGVDMILGD